VSQLGAITEQVRVCAATITRGPMRLP
jgi:hypothetical protein